jgi:hypothetical protein
MPDISPGDALRVALDDLLRSFSHLDSTWLQGAAEGHVATSYITADLAGALLKARKLTQGAPPFG